MNIVGTPYSEVQRSSCTARSVAAGSKRRRRDHHAGAVRGGREVAHHHAEAVVEGHRQADPVLLGVADQLADEVAVVEDVVVAESVAPLGKPVVPEVYWMLIGSSAPSAAIRSRQPLGVDAAPPRRPGRPSSPRRCRRRRSAPGTRRAPARPSRGSPSVLCATALTSSRMPGLVDDVGQLVAAVGRVDVDQDRADLGRGVLHQHPLRRSSATRCRPGRPWRRPSRAGPRASASTSASSSA